MRENVKQGLQAWIGNSEQQQGLENRRWTPNQNGNIIQITAVEATFPGTPETQDSTWIVEAILTRTGMENKLPSCSWKDALD